MTLQPGYDRAVQRVLWMTLVANVAVAIGKISIGAAVGSLSITADGFHSALDGASNIIGLVASRIAAQPPDARHPYGHRRFETVAALGIGILLLITAWEIVRGALERLQSGTVPQINPLTFAVMIGTLIINIAVATYEGREGKRLGSQFLIADGANTRADVFVTLSVLVSMGLVGLGFVWADSIAALIIVVLIGRAAWQILQQTAGVLVDTAPILPDDLTVTAEAIPAIAGLGGRVIRARSRGTREAAHVDIDMQIAAQTTTANTAALAGAIRDGLRARYEGIQEVEVHFIPTDAPPERALELTARAHADALGLSVHEVRLSDTPSQEATAVEMHVEVPPGQTLSAAHAQVSQLEDALRASLRERGETVGAIITHIEPAAHSIPADHSASNDRSGEGVTLAAAAMTLLRRDEPQMRWHEVRIAPGEGGAGWALTVHGALPGDTPVEAAHTLAERAELRLRGAFPTLTRVTIHTEPYEEA